jgi:hypothetical protein
MGDDAVHIALALLASPTSAIVGADAVADPLRVLKDVFEREFR